MKVEDLVKRVDQLILKSNDVLASAYHTNGIGYRVQPGPLAGLRASTLSFISMAYGKSHSHYSEFINASANNYKSNAEGAHAILVSIKDELEGGWVFSYKKLVAAEIFSDFLEMAEYLLSSGYKDPAAVMIGSVLEENLRQLCIENEIEIETEKGESLVPKKADRLNSDLAKAEVYTKLDQKAVTAWLDMRNKAAHGKYTEYSEEQVKNMLQSITEFLARVNA